MKLVIAGGRDLHIHWSFLDSIIGNVFFWDDDEEISEIVSGGATGIDTAAKQLAMAYDEEVDYIEFRAEWDKYGKAAGPKRNELMAEYGDALLLIWDGESRGSRNMRSNMKRLGKPIYEIIIKENQ